MSNAKIKHMARVPALPSVTNSKSTDSGDSVPSATYLDLSPSNRPDTVLHLTSCLWLTKCFGTHDCRRKPVPSVQSWEASIDLGFSNVIQYSIIRVRVACVPFNYPTNLYFQWISLWSHLFGNSQLCPKRRCDIFPDAGNFWLHSLNGKWHSQLTLPLIHNWFREFEKHNPWFWIIAFFVIQL